MYAINYKTTKRYIDLHIHTKHSDGACSVREVLGMAYDKGLKAISITDHDSIGAYPEAFKIGREIGIQVIPGIELSCEYQGKDIHILGYNIDIENIKLVKTLENLREARFIRAKKMVENLNNMGIDLRFETVLRIAGAGAIGRPHIAMAMLHEEFVYSFKEAFDRYIGYESPAYVEKMKLSPEEVFKLIRDAKGIPVIAHPGISDADHLLEDFISMGLMGIEVYYSEHNKNQKQYYKDLCIKHNLAITGGSDFHDQKQTRAIIGTPIVPYTYLERLYSVSRKNDLIL